MSRLGSYFRYLRLRMLRDRMPPNRVAAGWAIGMFIGCTVPFGLQLIVSIPLSLATRTSKIGATLGTFITNPVTIFFIYPVQTWVGARLIGAPLDWADICGYCARLSTVSLFTAEGWRTLSEIGGVVLGGYFLGGLLLAAVCTPPTYFGVRHMIESHRARRARRRAARGCAA